MRIDKIVVGTDFSEQSRTPVDHAASIARRCGAEIVLVHATTMPAVDVAEIIGPVQDVPDERLERAYAEERAQLEALCDQLRRDGVKASPLMVNELPDEAIVKAAEQTGADLIVLGTHGRTGLRRVLLGSTAEKVVRCASTAVLVVRPDATPHPGYRKILVATDFSPFAHKALHAALELAAPGAEVELYHSWVLPATATGRGIPGAETVGQKLRQQIEVGAEARARQWLDRHPRADVRLSFVQEEKPAAAGIHDRLVAGQFDLCALGSHGRRGLRRFLLGSVSEMTVRYAPCSVLVVHGTYDADD